MIEETDLEKWYGMMDKSILVNGKLIKQMDTINKKTNIKIAIIKI